LKCESSLLPIRMLGISIENGTGSLIWPQFRKYKGLTESGLGMLASVVQMMYADFPDYEGFRLELVDVSAPEGKKEREYRCYDFPDFPTYTSVELKDFFTPIYHAIKELDKEGFYPKPKLRKSPPEKSDHPDLFG